MSKKSVRILVLLCFLLVGGGDVFAQERFVLLDSQLLQDEKSITKYYLDIDTVKSFVFSKFQDAWIKKTFSVKEPDLENVTVQKNERGEIEAPPKKLEKNKKGKGSKAGIAYQLIHLQFDPVNSQYKILEVQSFGEHGQAIVDLSKPKKKNRAPEENDILLKPLDWTRLFPGTIEEMVGKALNDYIEKNTGRVKYY